MARLHHPHAAVLDPRQKMLLPEILLALCCVTESVFSFCHTFLKVSRRSKAKKCSCGIVIDLPRQWNLSDCLHTIRFAALPQPRAAVTVLTLTIFFQPLPRTHQSLVGPSSACWTPTGYPSQSTPSCHLDEARLQDPTLTCVECWRSVQEES